MGSLNSPPQPLVSWNQEMLHIDTKNVMIFELEMHKNAFAVETLPQIPLGEITVLPQTS